jgi:hypothetical protein
VRCGRCGNENAGNNRFCGMCGASLVGTTPAAAEAQVAAPTRNVAAPKAAGVPVQPVPAPSAPRQSEDVSTPESARFRSTNLEPRRAPLSPPRADVRPGSGPVITGSSFLGLSTPGPAVDSHAEPDPLRPSSNLDYLLEDDEEEPKRGWGKLVLISAALALAVGFGYLNWKQGGFDWLNGGDKKPAKQAADGAQRGDSGGATGPAASDSSAPAAAGGAAPATGGAAGSPAESAGGQNMASPTSSPAAPSQAEPAQTGPGQNISSQNISSQTSRSQAQPNNPNLQAASAPSLAGSGPDKQTAPAQPPPEPKPVSAKSASAKPAAARPFDAVGTAERYIYGRGVRQDCDHGIRLLKSAAEQSNAKAMISMGAMYSTGTCTPRDLPTAYRWFALALHKDPDNQALQDDLQKLWSQMTPPERQLAIKLGQ